MSQEEKKAIRAAMRRRLAEVSEAQRAAGAGEVFARIEELPVFARARTVALYNALPDELPTAAVIERWRGGNYGSAALYPATVRHSREGGNLLYDKSIPSGKQIVLPCVDGEQRINSDVDGGTMREGCFGIGEPCGAAVDPSEIDLMIVPGVAFDRLGHRLGRGKGFYDRFLAGNSTKVYTIGVCYPFQLLEILPCEPHDQPMDMVVTASV